MGLGPWVEWAEISENLMRGIPGALEDNGKKTRARIVMKDCVGTEAQKWYTWNECDDHTLAETLRDDRRVLYTIKTNCTGNSSVSLLKVKKGGHRLYKGYDTSVDTTAIAWDFVKKFRNAEGPAAVAQIDDTLSARREYANR